jgi:hypothetical protein
MSEGKKTNTEGGSFAEAPQEEKNQKPTIAKPEEETVFTYLKQIVSAIEAKDAQTAHHLDRIALALEKIAKMERDVEDLKKSPATIPASTPVTPKLTTPVPASTPTPTPASAPVSTFMDSIKSAFPQELANMLFFEAKDNIVIIKPRQYLGSENFAKIASVVRSLGGEYVSAGKESHFRVQKK